MDCGVDDNTKCAFPMNDAKLIDQRIKTIGVVSCNINCNFTNYGSALQSWALSHAIERCEKSIITKLVDYCPTIHLESDPLNPIKKMCSSAHGIFQARILDWVAISSSRGSSRPRD